MNRPSRRSENRGGFRIGNHVRIESDRTRPNTPHKPWLLSKTDPGSNDQRLCPVCRTINLRWLLRHTVERTLPNLVDFGSVDAISKRSSCPLCRLVITALCTAWGTDDASDLTKLRSASGEKIQCKVTSSEVGAVQLAQGDTVFCLEVFTNALWMPFKSNSGYYLKRIMLLDEDAPNHHFSMLDELEIRSMFHCYDSGWISVRASMGNGVEGLRGGLHCVMSDQGA